MLYKCFMVYFTTFLLILKILGILQRLGGGYVVKTYPSIDPIVPPPRINMHISVRLFPSRVVT